jgi:membrane-bound lytic murein transglycosylase A
VNWRPGAAALAALALASCATTPPPRHISPRSPPPHHEAEAPPAVTAVGMTQLPGWDAENHVAALALVRQVCRDAPEPSRTCDEALGLDNASDAEARAFLETHFRPELIPGAGVLTAYFSPAYEARERRDAEFSAPVRPRPADPAAAPDRATLDDERAPDALAWMRPEDLFFLQIQGSGALSFPDGRQMRAVFAGSNGRPFFAVANTMVAGGLIGARDATAGGVHDWLAQHRGDAAEAVMRLDPRYVFFRLVPDDGQEPRGAAGAALLAGRSLAVDPAYHPYFELLWLDAADPHLSGARSAYRRLAAALDTGSAIKGEVRADLYLGRGPAAGAEAGTVRHALRLYRIVPIEGSP